MNKLIKNEWKKLFSKKVMYILFIITIVFTILINVMYNIEISIDTDDFYIATLEQQLKELNYKSAEDNEYYIDIKTQYDIEMIKKQYEKDSWQYNIIIYNNILEPCIRKINENTYGLQKNQEELKVAQKELNTIKERLDQNNWKVFIEEEIAEIKEEIKFYEEQIKNTKNKKTIEQLSITVANSKDRIQALSWRIEKDIPYGDSFLSGKIEEYISSSSMVNTLQNVENKSKEDLQEYKAALKQMTTSKYYIENNINIKKEYDGRYMLMHLMDEYGIFISIFSIIVAGTIVSNEFQKGTIKLLLTKPFSRGKILWAKYIVSMLSILIFVLVFFVTQFVVGGIINGFSIYQIPAVEFDYHTNSIVILSTFYYAILMILTKLPIYVLLATLAFALSTLTMNSAVSVALPILGNMAASIINLFIDRVKIIKYFVTANWDLSVYLFGGEGIAEGLNFWLSLVICCIYLVMMLITSFIIFQRRDIKNV